MVTLFGSTLGPTNFGAALKDLGRKINGPYINHFNQILLSLFDFNATCHCYCQMSNVIVLISI